MYDLEKRIFLNDNYQKHKSISKVQKAYRTKYKSKTAPSASVIINIANNYKTTGSVQRRRCVTRKRTVRTHDLINDLKNLFMDDDKLSLRKAANLVDASHMTIRKVAREDLNLKPYKRRRTFKLYRADYKKRLDFVKFVKSRRLNLEDSFICSDEAYFYLHGGHNIQNDRIWAEFQPNERQEKPLNDEKAMVWCAFSAKKVYGPFFFTENVNGENYLEMLKKFFWPKHAPLQKIQRYYFQQDGAPPHRRIIVQNWLKRQFGDRFLTSMLWPARSPDLNPCDFSLWGTLKANVYNPKPETIEQLKENIKREVKIFSKTDLTSIFRNLKKRLDLVEQEKGGYIEHLL